MGTDSSKNCYRLRMSSSRDPEENASLVEIGDPNGLTDRIDSLCLDEFWDLVVDLRDRCRAALARGKQLWPAAAYAEYRMALDAPPELAASVLDSQAERFVLGPFAEIIASTHTFVDLTPFLHASPSSGIVAHERVLRGERLGDVAWLGPYADVLGVPLWLEDWEPEYPLADYAPSRARFPSPAPDAAMIAAVGTVANRVNDPETIRALMDIVRVWCAESNGHVEVVSIEGSASDAVATLGCRSHRIGRVTPQTALALIAWAGGNGGAHGRRRGMAAGRQCAWWALTHLAGLGEELDVQPFELGRAAEELEWFVWDDGSPATGWSLRMAMADPIENLAWAINASDAKLE